MVDVAERDRLIPAARRVMRTKHLSRISEEAYVRWIVRYVRFHGMRHPRTLGEQEMREFLSHLATEQNVSASTQSQALAALLFLYVEVLRDPVPWIADVIRARRPARLPVVMTREAVRAVLGKMRGAPKLVGLRGHVGRAKQAGDVSHVPPFVRDASFGRRHDIRTVQELLGHRSVATTMIYTHVLNRGRWGCGARWIGCSWGKGGLVGAVFGRGGEKWNEMVRYSVFGRCTQGYALQYSDTLEASCSRIDGCLEVFDKGHLRECSVCKSKMLQNMRYADHDVHATRG